jgi:phage tail sheath protein FI
MPEYLSPGVYIEEPPAGPVPIAGVATSTTGMVGFTERGPLEPRLVTSWLEYVRWFGDPVPVGTSYLSAAVRGFFDNGGQRLFVARIVRSDAGDPAAVDLPTADPAQTLQLAAIGPGAWGSTLFVRVQPAARQSPAGGEFRITILYYRVAPPTPLIDPSDPRERFNAQRREPDITEVFEPLAVRTGAADVPATINATSRLVEAQWADPDAVPSRPNDTGGYTPFQGGGDGDPTASVAAADYVGDPDAAPDERVGLTALEAIDEIALLAVPDEVHEGVIQDPAQRDTLTTRIVEQCERLRDRFAVLAAPGGVPDIQQIRPPRDTSYAAFYHPWVRVLDEATAADELVPPQGHVLGIYARTDIERGVHKAPANSEVRGIITRDLSPGRGPLQYRRTKGEHDILNPRGVDVIRDFRASNRGIRVWGGRTMSSDAQWRYVNVRRLFIFVEESIDEGTQWVVFEGNYESTWARVVRSVSNFLTTVWRDGALAGVTPEEAFFVRCDRTTMTPDDIDNGRLICLVGIAPVRPAEFVIFRISQKTIEFQS